MSPGDNEAALKSKQTSREYTESDNSTARGFEQSARNRYSLASTRTGQSGHANSQRTWDLPFPSRLKRCAGMQ